MLWKGIGSSLTIRGLSLGMEDCISKVTNNSFPGFFGHTLLLPPLPTWPR